MTYQNQPASNSPQPSQPGPPPGPPELQPAPGKRPGFPLMAAIAVVLVILAVATTGLVLTRAGGSSSYGADTPQAVVQAWARAMEAGDYATADSYLSESALANGESSQMMMVFGDWTGFTIVGTSVQGDRATVDATITFDSSSTIPGISVVKMSMPFPMVRENGAWKIDGLGLGQPYAPQPQGS